MSKEKGEELFRALHILGLNLKDLEAEAKGESSTQRATASSKGKDKDINPDWEDVPFHLVPITPLSCNRPRFSQVVGSSSKTPIVPPSLVAVAASFLAIGPVAQAAWDAINAPQRGVSGVFVVLNSFQLSGLQVLSLQDTERRFGALVSPARKKMWPTTKAVLTY
jgi:hypothetical protein